MSDISLHIRRYVKRQPTLLPRVYKLLLLPTKKPVQQKSSGDEQEKPRPDDYFTMCLVNGYGSQVLRNLTDDNTQLTLNS